MKVLVLGSSGQIGKSICSHLINSGHSIIEWDIKNSEEQDLSNYNAKLEQAMLDSDFVYYFASDVGGAKYLEKNQNSYDFIMNNMSIMMNVFESLRITQKPFIFTSSQMADIHESTYGTLKLVGEKITSSLGGLYVRLWNVYGEETDEEKFHVITDFIKMAKRNSVINVRTDGKESRQFLSVDDLYHCLQFLTLNFDNLDKSKNYHITSFEWISIARIAEIISSLSGCKVVFSDAKDKTQMNMMNEPDRYIMNFWRPTVSIEDGIKNLFNKVAE